LASVTVHSTVADFWAAVPTARVYAFTGRATAVYSDVAYEPGDVLLFGTERTGLPDEVLSDARVTEQVRLPMIPDRRSLNLSNAASIALYEAWRQNGFAGA
jgi:tRNA (cytidine/uridine-2'-O-)-methyltransferase